MKMLQEFKEFAMKGNVLDMAVGVIIGGAFGKIVSSVVADIFMPVLGVLTGGINFTDLKLTLKPALNGSPEVALAYGKFIQNVFDFIIIAFCIFLLVKAVNSLHRKPAPAPSTPPLPTPTETLLTEIRDLLRRK